MHTQSNNKTKQQQDKVFEMDFIGSQKPHSPRYAPFGTKSYINNIQLCDCFQFPFLFVIHTEFKEGTGVYKERSH